MIKILDINGAIVVADALHCQIKSAKEVIGEGGDYLFVVKDNNPTFKDIELYVKNEEMDHFTQKELLKYARAEWSIESMHWL